MWYLVVFDLCRSSVLTLQPHDSTSNNTFRLGGKRPRAFSPHSHVLHLDFSLLPFDPAMWFLILQATAASQYMTWETDLRHRPQALSATRPYKKKKKRQEMQRTRRWTALIQRHWGLMGGRLVTTADIIGGKMKHINFLQPQRWQVASRAPPQWLSGCSLTNISRAKIQKNVWIPRILFATDGRAPVSSWMAGEEDKAAV